VTDVNHSGLTPAIAENRIALMQRLASMLSSTLKDVFKKIECSLRTSKQGNLCPVCGSKGKAFLPLPDFYRRNASKYGYRYFGKGEMTALDSYSCCNCGASDRERIYAHWIREEFSSGRFSGTEKVIHFAPEKMLSRFIRQSRIFLDYKTADMMMSGVDYKVDLMHLPFAENSFDFFICSHVLEHVSDDRLAMRELYRITRVGGRGILMAPVVAGLPETIEDPTADTEEDRWRLFGQNDHVRLYAHDDYVRRIKESGFDVQQLGQNEFGMDAFERLGLKDSSILYIVRKQ
jgi:SAM-dependent methyltransferase